MTHASGSVFNTSGGASWNGTRRRLPGTATSVAFHVSKNQSFFFRNSALIRPMACRNAIASSMASFVSVIPPRPSIIADVTSFDAMIVYSGEVDACIMNDSLKRAWGIAPLPSRMCRIRRLRQRSEQLVRRMRRKYGRTGVIFRIAAHGVAIAIDRVEARIAVPRLVPMHPVDGAVEQLFDGNRVVAQAVVRRVRHDAVHRRAGRCRSCTSGFDAIAFAIDAFLN